MNLSNQKSGLLFATLTAIFFVFPLAIQASTEIQITTDTAAQLGPDIYGNQITWADYRRSFGDIYLYDIALNQENNITPEVTNNSRGLWAIYADKVLWQEEYFSETGSWLNTRSIHVYDIPTGADRVVLTTNKSVVGADIYENQIVWGEGGYFDNPGIYLHDLTASTTVLIDTDDPDKFQDKVGNPKISDGKVLYSWEWVCGMWCIRQELRLYDIKTGEKKTLFQFGSPIYDFEVDGDNIIYVGYAGSEGYSIARYKISTGETSLIAVSPEIYGIDISGDIAVWSNRYDIFIHNLTTGETERAGTAQKESMVPKIDNGLVVWQDYRGVSEATPQNMDIYLYRLSENNPPTLSYSQGAGYTDDGINPDEGTPETSFTFKIVYTDQDNDPPTDIRTVVFDGSPSDAPAIEISSDVMILDSLSSPELRDGNYTNGEQYALIKFFPTGVYRYRWQWSDGKLPFPGLYLIL